MKDDRLYLIHVHESITRIEEYTAEGREAFFADTRTQDAVLRNLQTLAESTQRLSEAYRRLTLKLIGAEFMGFVIFWSMTIWALTLPAYGRLSRGTCQS